MLILFFLFNNESSLSRFSVFKEIMKKTKISNKIFSRNSSYKNENNKKRNTPQAIQDVDDFVSSLEQVWRNVALHHLLTSGCSAVNGCRQNESPNS